MQAKAIIFDAGGTLLYAYPSVGDIYAEVMNAHGMSVSAAAVNDRFADAWSQASGRHRLDNEPDPEKAWWRVIVGEVVETLGGIEEFDPMFESLWVTFADPARWRLHDGAHETLTELRRRGYRLGLLSNWDQRLPSILDGLAIGGYFEHAVISSQVGMEKPEIGIFRETERVFGLAPSDILLVGDSPHHDAGGAENAGWHWLLVHTAYTDGLDSELVLPCLADVLSRVP